jgi:hypothetical protein
MTAYLLEKKQTRGILQFKVAFILQIHMICDQGSFLSREHLTTYAQKRVISRRVYQWLKTGFGLINGFIDHLEVVTTITYNTSKITVIITHK